MLLLALPKNRRQCWKELHRYLPCRSLTQHVGGVGSRIAAVAGWAKLRRAWQAEAEDTVFVHPEGWISELEIVRHSRGDQVRMHPARKT
jgi:hypothetical protein